METMQLQHPFMGHYNLTDVIPDFCRFVVSGIVAVHAHTHQGDACLVIHFSLYPAGQFIHFIHCHSVGQFQMDCRVIFFRPVIEQDQVIRTLHFRLFV